MTSINDAILSVDFETFEEDNKTKFLIGAVAWGPEYSDSRVVTSISQIPTGMKIVGHNLKYDLNYWGEYPPIPYLDTWIAAKYLFPNEIRQEGKLTLKNLAQRECGMAPWGSAGELIAKYGGMEKVPPDELEKYVRTDAVANYRLAVHFIKILKSKNMFPACRIESGNQVLSVMMEQQGIPIDSSMADELDLDIQRIMSDLQDEVDYIAGRKVYINSPMDVSKLLFTELAIKPAWGQKKGKAGYYSTSQKAVEKIRDRHPAIEKILSWRSLQTMRSTYIPTVRRSKDGFLRGTWNDGTVSGRYNGHPYLCIPKHDEQQRKLLRAFKAPPGKIFVVVDIKTADLRSLTALAGIKFFEQQFENHIDMHVETASLAYLIPRSQVTADQRRRAKSINFGLVYGMSAAGAGFHIGWDRARTFFERFFEMIPELKIWWKKLEEDIKDHGYVQDYFGRPFYSKNFYNAIKNIPVQSTTMKLIELLGLRVYKFLALFGYQVACLHDDLEYLIQEDSLQDFVQMVRNMAKTMDFPIEIELEIKAGHTLYDLKEIN